MRIAAGQPFESVHQIVAQQTPLIWKRPCACERLPVVPERFHRRDETGVEIDRMNGHPRAVDCQGRKSRDRREDDHGRLCRCAAALHVAGNVA